MGTNPLEQLCGKRGVGQVFPRQQAPGRGERARHRVTARRGARRGREAREGGRTTGLVGGGTS